MTVHQSLSKQIKPSIESQNSITRQDVREFHSEKVTFEITGLIDSEELTDWLIDWLIDSEELMERSLEERIRLSIK